MVQVAENKQIEAYKTKDTRYAKVVEIAEHFVFGSFLLNEEEKTFKRVRYNKDVLSELDLKVGDVIEVTVFTKPGEIKSTYIKNTEEDVLKKFDPKERVRDDYFKDLKDSPLFQPLPSEE